MQVKKMSCKVSKIKCFENSYLMSLKMRFFSLLKRKLANYLFSIFSSTNHIQTALIKNTLNLILTVIDFIFETTVQIKLNFQYQCDISPEYFLKSSWEFMQDDTQNSDLCDFPLYIQDI